MENKAKLYKDMVEILIVEDSPTQAEKLRYLLEQNKYKVFIANNGKQAITFLNKQKPTLVISDIVMPEMNGYQLCKQIKSDVNTWEIPVILLTSLSDSGDVLEGLACGADNFITKPYNDDYLISIIEYILTNLELHKKDRVRVGLEIQFGGKRRFISADQQQMLTMLISTYEAAIQRNKELIKSQDELRSLNEQLEELVDKRTVALSVEIAERKQAEDILRESEEHYRSLFENMLNGVAYCKMFFYDGRPQDFIYLTVNSSFELLTGLKDVTGKKVSEVIPGVLELDRELIEIYGKVALTGKPERFEIYLKALKMWFSVAVYSPQKEYFVSVFDVITDRKKAEETLTKERNLLYTLIDNLPDYIYVKDTGGRIVIDNVAHRQMLGVNSLAEVEGKTDFDFFQQELAASYRIDDQEVIQSGNPLFNREETIIDNDGNKKYMLTTKMPLQDQYGETTGIVGISHDITNRKQIENEREQLFRCRQSINQLQQSLLEPASLENKLKIITDNIVRIFNADFCRIWLIQPGDLCEKGCVHALVKEGPHVCVHRDKCLHMLASSGRYTHIDGETHRRVPFGSYKIGRIASEKEYKFLTNDVVNDPFVHDHEWAREMDLVSFVGYQLRATGGKTLGVMAMFAKHPILPAEDSMLDGLSNTVAMVIQQTISEEERRISEEKLQSIFNASPEAVTLLDLNGILIDCNPKTLKLYGFSTKDEIVGHSFLNLVVKGEQERAINSLRDTIDKDFLERFELSLINKNGLVFPGELSAGVIHDISGNPHSIVLLSKDITERKKSEKERIRLVTVIEQVSEIIIITDVNGTIQYVNPAFEKITGYSVKEAIGQNPRFLKSGAQDDEFYKNMWDTLLNGEKWSGRFTNKKKDGQLYTEESTITPIKDDSGIITNFAAVKRDITDELLAEQRIRDSQKMEAIGTLAGGIAHDFNNILAAIMGYTELSLDSVPEDSQLYSDLTNIYKAGNRARSLINQILSFSRQRETEKRPILIIPIIKESLKLLHASLPSSIEIRQNIESEEGTVVADPTQIHQIIMNLCTNAGHSMRDKGGVLEVSLLNRELDSDFCQVHPGLIPGQYLILVISDTGHGIDPSILPRIFEPYFTTKEKSGGTGLGLSVVHGIVTDCGGTVTVYSEPGKGSTFKVYLPVIVEKPIDEIEITHSVAKGHERILFIDDEQDIVDVGKRILEQLGYMVGTITSSTDALELFRKDPYQFDLVITDMTMPLMTGDELATEFLRIREDIPIIVCTGYSEKLTEEKALSIGIQAYLGKPLLKSDMAETVRRVLDKHKGDI